MDQKRGVQLIMGAVLVISLLLGFAGCSSAKKKPAVPANQGSTTDLIEATEPVFNARVQAISRKKQLLTLKFNDEKVAKIKVSGSVRNFEEVGVGDSIKAKFDDQVEVFPVNAAGKPVWPEIKEIKKAPKGTPPSAATVRPYEYASTVTAVDYLAKKITIKGPAGHPIRLTATADATRFNEIKAGDSVVARFTQTNRIDIEPPERATSAMRPSRRR